MAWIADAEAAIAQQKPPKFSSNSGLYKMTVQLVRPDKRRRDLDNVSFKAISDLLVSVGVLEDDCNSEILMSRWVTSGPAAYVKIEPAGVE